MMLMMRMTRMTRMMSSVGNIEFGLNPMMLRCLRLGKLLRIVRLVKLIHAFTALHLLIASIKSSLTTLVWSIIVLLVMQFACAMFLTQLLESFLTDESVPVEKRIAVYTYFGSFSWALITMFEVTASSTFLFNMDA